MTTVGAALYRVRDKVYGAQRLQLDRLVAGITDDQTVFALQYGSAHPAYGSVISIGSESMYVWSYDSTTKMVSTSRGWNGTIPFAWPTGAEVEVNVRFPSPSIISEMRDEIAGWPQSLYRVVAANHSGLGSSTVAGAVGSMFLDPELAGCYGIIDVRRSPSSSLYTTWPRVNSVELVHQMDEDSFTTGDMLSINEPLDSGYGSSTVGLRVIAAMPFDTDTFFSTTTDLEDDVGLAPSMVDLAVLGTAIRLIMPQEIKRSSRQAADEPRNAAEVPPGLSLQTGSGLLRTYENRLKVEANKLSARFPIRYA